MNNLIPQLNKATELLSKYPEMERSSHLTTVVKSLGNSLGKFLAKAEEHEMQYLPGYSEVAYLLEGEARSVADLKFMQNFSQLKLGQKFPASRADKPTRLKFLRCVAKAGKLSDLRTELDPGKRYKDLFDQIVKLDAETLAEKLKELSSRDLTGLVDANKLKAPRVAREIVSKRKQSIDQIVAQIKQIKLVEHY
jgi:hypothetical protein